MSLTPELEAFIDGRVTTGRYRSASEVVRAALRLLDENERRREAPRRSGVAVMDGKKMARGLADGR